MVRMSRADRRRWAEARTLLFWDDAVASAHRLAIKAVR